MAPLVVLTILFGFYPAPILDASAASVEALIKNYETALAAAEQARIALAALGGTVSSTLQFAVALPELTLAVGAMVLLMVGVATRKEQAELILWLAVLVLALAGFFVLRGQRHGHRCSATASSSIPSPG